MIKIQNTKHSVPQAGSRSFGHFNIGTANLFVICNLFFGICILYGISLTKKSLMC